MTQKNDKTAASAGFKDELKQMRQKKAQRARKRNMIIGISVAVAAVIALIVVFIQINRSYSSYNIISSEFREDESGAGYISYKDGYIRCSPGGVERVGAEGESMWNIVHSMTNPCVKVSGDIIAAADINGNLIELFDENGIIGRIDTQFSILQTEITPGGLVAAVMQDDNDNYINMYNRDAEHIYSVKTSINGEGYPVDIAVSDDGKGLAVSYVKVAGNKIESGVALYDFGRDAKESALAGTFNNFNGEPVGVVEFFGDDTVVAVAGDSLSCYSANEVKEKKRIDIEPSVNKVIFEEDKMALIYSSGRIQVLDKGTGVISDTESDMLYSDYRFDGNRIIMTKDNSFAVMDISGKFITAQDTELPVDSLLPNGTKNRYFLMSEKYIQRIKLV